MTKTNMAMCIFTCLRIMVLSKRQQLVNNRQKIVYLARENVKIHPWCLFHCADLSLLPIFYKFDENWCISTPFDLFRGKPKIADHVPKTRNSNIVLVNCADASLMTIIGNS